MRKAAVWQRDEKSIINGQAVRANAGRDWLMKC